VVVVEQIVIFDALKRRPTTGQRVSEVERVSQPGEIEWRVAPGRGSRNEAANALSQDVAVADVEAHAGGRLGDASPRLSAPIFGDLDGVGLGVTHCAAQVLAEEPAAVLVHHRDLIVT